MQDPVKTRGESTETTGYFNRESAGWSQKYEASRHFSARLTTVLEWISEAGASGCAVLDYGCGSGVLIRELAERGFQVTGVDISPGMLDSAQLALQARGTPAHAPRLELIVPPDYTGQYQDASYKIVVSLGVLEYVEDLDAYLQRLVSRLEPGGSLILSLPNRASLLRKAERFIFNNAGLIKPLGLVPQLTGPDSYLRFQKHQLTLAELDTKLARYGLQRRKAFYHVVPGRLSGLESHPRLAMTLIAQYGKPA